MSGYQLTQAEWNIYISNLPDEALPNKRLYADAPMMFSTLRSDAAEAIGEDIKLMIKDRSVIHGARSRRDSDGSLADVNLSINKMKRIPRSVANPEAIYKDNITGNLVFRYPVDKQHDVKVVFLPGRKLTQWCYIPFFLTVRTPLIMTKDTRYYGKDNPPSPGFEPGYTLDITFYSNRCSFPTWQSHTRWICFKVNSKYSVLQ